MTQTEINDYITNNYKQILSSVKKTKSKYNPNCSAEPDEIITYAYLHIIKHIDKIDSIKKLESILYRYITNSIVWTNSEINRIDDKRLSYFPTMFDMVDCDIDIEFKLSVEQKYQHQKAILFQFRNQLDKEQQILFDVIFIKKKYMLKEIVEHFGINEKYMRRVKKELFADLDAFIKEKYNINKTI